MDHRWDGAGYGGRGGGGIRVVFVVVVAGGGKRDCRRGCLRQTASHRRVVHSKDGTKIGRLESRWSLNAPSFGPRPQKDRLDKRIRSVLGGYRARPNRHTKLEASRERVRRGPRDKKVDVCATNIAHVDSDSASRPLSSGWPAQPSAWPRAACDALGDGGTAGHVLF